MLRLTRGRTGADNDSAALLTPILGKSKITKIEVLKDGQVKASPSSVYSLIKQVEPREDGDTADPVSKIYLVKGGESPVSDLGPWVVDDPDLRREFLQAHINNDDDQQREVMEATEGRNVSVFFASWWKLVVQKKDQHRIHKRILSKKPYDIDTIDDPLNLHLPHRRFMDAPRMAPRPCHLISFAEGGEEVYKAAQECMSYLCVSVKGIKTGK